MKTPRVLCVVSKQMIYDGITMTVLRFARNMDMTRIHMDFVSIGEPAEGIRDEVEGMGSVLYVINGRLKNPLSYMLKLAGLVRKGGYDAVHVHGNSCTLAIDLLGALLGGAKVRIAHSHNTTCRYMKAHRLLRPLFDMLYTAGFACGDEAGRWLYGNRKYTVIHNAVESARYAFDPDVRAEYRRMLGIGDELVLASVANINDQKNHGFMLDAFANLKKVRRDVRLVLVGDGPGRATLEEKTATAGLKSDVIMLGTRNDVPKLLQAFDVMLLPSLYEGFPNVLVEWQCAGLRSLVSDRVTPAVALTELVRFLPIDKGTGPWVDALKDMKADTQREMTGASAVMQVRDKGYDIVKNARDLEKFYIDAVNGSK